MSITSNSMVGAATERTAFVWGPIELKEGTDEILCRVRELIEMGVLPVGETVQVTAHLDTDSLVISPYRSGVERKQFHPALVGQTVRMSAGRIAIPVQHSGVEPSREDLRVRGGYDTGLTPGTVVFPFAVAKSLYDGRPRIYLLTEQQYRSIREVLPRYPGITSGEDKFTFIYWSGKVSHQMWGEDWIAVEVEPGTFNRCDACPVPSSQMSEILFDSSEPLFDNNW